MNMSLFDKLLENPTYSSLFNQLSDEDKSIMLQSMRKLVEDFENGIILPYTTVVNNVSGTIDNRKP